jgi:hypothetical protein
VSTGDQVECDRAELNGTVVYAWRDGTNGLRAAIDKTTGAVLVSPTNVGGQNMSRAAARGAVDEDPTDVHNGTDGAPGAIALALDPTRRRRQHRRLADALLTATNYGTYYDITRVIGRRPGGVRDPPEPDDLYKVGTVTAALVVATATKARTCDGPIAVSSDRPGQGAGHSHGRRRRQRHARAT